MNKIQYLLIIIIGVFIIFSCNTGSDNSLTKELSLEIITNKVISNHFNLDDLRSDKYLETISDHNIIRFKLYNGLNKVQIINSLNFKTKNNGLGTSSINSLNFNTKNNGLGTSSINSFPSPFTGLSLYNLLITDENGERIKRSGTKSSYSNEFLNFISKKDSIQQLHYQNLGYSKIDEYFTDYNDVQDLNTIIINPGETKYFEVYFDLPFNKPSLDSSREVLELIKEKKYSLSLIFRSDSTGLRNELTTNQLLNFEANNQEFYHGEIISKNAIPLIVK